MPRYPRTPLRGPAADRRIGFFGDFFGVLGSFLGQLGLAQVLAILAADRDVVSDAALSKLAAIGIALALAGRSRAGRRLAAALALGAASAFGLAERLDEASRHVPAAPLEATLEATVTRAAPLPGAVELDLAGVRAVGGEGPLPPRLRLRAPIEGVHDARTPPFASVLPGDRLRLRARLRPFEERANPGGRGRARDLARIGIATMAAPVHPDLVVRLPDGERIRPLAALHRFRARAGARLAAEGEGGELLRALALGDRGGLERPSIDAFRSLGLTHLLSVSGVHLALAGALFYRIARRALLRSRRSVDPRRPALLLAAGAAGGYALLAGWDVPVRRSLVMLIGLALSFAARRSVQRGAPLLGAAVLVLAFDPEALFDAGAQMSFGASAALVAGSSRASSGAGEPARWGRARRWLAEMLQAGAVANAATAPIAASAIGVLSPWALAANLAAIPWTELALLPCALVAALAAGLAPDARVSGLLLRASAAVAAASLEGLRRTAAALPDAWTASPGAAAVAAALLAALLLVRVRGTIRRCVGSLAITLALALAPPARIDPAPPRLVSLDVGQGDAAVVQGRSAALLIDGGPAVPGGRDLGESVVLPALRALGVRRLDLVVASHGDLDHRGGLPAVVRALPVGRVWLPFGGLRDPAFEALIEIARARGVAVEERGAGSAAAQLGDLRVTPLWPPPDEAASGGPGRRNDRSLTVRVDAAGRGLLFPGDIEAGAEARLVASGALLRADVLKLPHHGSRTSSSARLLDAVDGGVAIVSAPRWSRFGMPHPEVVARVAGDGYAVWWTGRDGAVLIGLDPRLWVRGWR